MIDNHTIQQADELTANVTRAALALDSLIVNGIQFGILNEMSPQFLERTSDELHTAVEALCDDANADHPDGVKALCEELRRATQQLISLLGLLRAFQSMAPPQIRAACAEVRSLRAGFVKNIQGVESIIGLTDRFYNNRPTQSSAAIEHFVANLEDAFLNAHNAKTIAERV